MASSVQKITERRWPNLSPLAIASKSLCVVGTYMEAPSAALCSLCGWMLLSIDGTPDQGDGLVGQRRFYTDGYVFFLCQQQQMCHVRRRGIEHDQALGHAAQQHACRFADAGLDQVDVADAIVALRLRHISLRAGCHGVAIDRFSQRYAIAGGQGEGI